MDWDYFGQNGRKFLSEGKKSWRFSQANLGTLSVIRSRSTNQISNLSNIVIDLLSTTNFVFGDHVMLAEVDKSAQVSSSRLHLRRSKRLRCSGIKQSRTTRSPWLCQRSGSRCFLYSAKLPWRRSKRPRCSGIEQSENDEISLALPTFRISILLV